MDLFLSVKKKNWQVSIKMFQKYLYQNEGFHLDVIGIEKEKESNSLTMWFNPVHISPKIILRTAQNNGCAHTSHLGRHSNKWFQLHLCWHTLWFTCPCVRLLSLMGPGSHHTVTWASYNLKSSSSLHPLCYRIQVSAEHALIKKAFCDHPITYIFSSWH